MIFFFFPSIQYSQNFWSASGLGTLRISSFTISSDNTIFAGKENNFINSDKIYRSNDNGTNWIKSDTGITQSSIFHMAVSPNGQIFADNFRSTDNGHTWSVLPSAPYLNVKDIAVSNTASVYYASSTNGLFRSTDNGDTFTDIASSITSQNVLSVLPANNGYLYAGTLHDLYRSKDDGATWVAVGLPLTPQVYALAEGPSEKLFACTSSGIYVSIDNGDTWVSKWPFSAPFSSVVITSDGNNAFAGMINFNGTLHSTDGGDSWNFFNDGLTDTYVNDIIITSTGTVFAGTRDGVFKGSVVITGIEEKEINIPKEFYLFQNYPNPFNPNTNINFSIPNSSFVTLKVYDVLGKEVANLVNEELSAGTYNFNFDAAKLTSGIYFYRIQTDNFVETKKMTLLK